jgi:hypothetical protein
MSIKSNEFFGCIVEQCIALIKPVRVIYTIYFGCRQVHRESLTELLLLWSKEPRLKFKVWARLLTMDAHSSDVRIRFGYNGGFIAFYNDAKYTPHKLHRFRPFVPNESEALLMSIVKEEIAKIMNKITK